MSKCVFSQQVRCIMECVEGVEHYALNKDLFLQKPISTDDLVKEINNKISSTE
jgi:hypothetical protein